MDSKLLDWRLKPGVMLLETSWQSNEERRERERHLALVTLVRGEF